MTDYPIPLITEAHIRHLRECLESPANCGTCRDIETLLRGVTEGGALIVIRRTHITPEDVETVDALWQLGCTCGVITIADGVRWQLAQDNAEKLIAKLKRLSA